MKKLIALFLLIACNGFAQTALSPVNATHATYMAWLSPLTSITWNGNAITPQYGGTGLATLTAHGVLIGEGTSNVAVTAAGTTGQWLKSQGASSDPVWSTATLAEPSTAGNILISDGTNWTAGTAVKQSTANTNSVADILTLTQNSSGVIAANFGTGLLLNGQSSTTADRNIAEIQGTWSTPTDASRVGQLVFRAANNTALGTIATMTPTVFNIPTGSAYQINGTSVLTNNTLGTGVLTSSLTTVGTIGTGVWNGSKVAEGYGGTNQSTYTTGDILYASTTNTLSKLAIGTTNYVLTVVSGAPAWAAAPSGGLSKVTQTADLTAAVNTSYLNNKASTQLAVTLPATAAVQDEIKIVGGSCPAGAKFVGISGTIFHSGAITGVTGTGAYISSPDQYGVIIITCIVANTEWSIEYVSGSWTLN